MILPLELYGFVAEHLPTVPPRTCEAGWVGNSIETYQAKRQAMLLVLADLCGTAQAIADLEEQE